MTCTEIRSFAIGHADCVGVPTSIATPYVESFPSRLSTGTGTAPCRMMPADALQ